VKFVVFDFYEIYGENRKRDFIEANIHRTPLSDLEGETTYD